MNKLRKFLQKFGVDIHRHYPKPNMAKYWQKLSIRTVLDIGANTGQFAKEIRLKLPEAQIYSFEPLKSCFEALVASQAGDVRFKAFNWALGETEGEITMHKSSYSPSSSILPMAEAHKELFPHTKEHTDEKIIIKRLDEISRDLDLKKEVLIKVDVQGFEEKVLDGGLETFKLAKAVIMEVSFVELYKNQPSFDTLYQKLINLGFQYSGSLEQKVDKYSGRIISEDALFMRI